MKTNSKSFVHSMQKLYANVFCLFMFFPVGGCHLFKEMNFSSKLTLVVAHGSDFV